MTSTPQPPASDGQVSRRGMLKAGAVGAIGLGVGPALFSRPARAAAPAAFNEAQFLMDHCTQGFNWEDFQTAQSMGYQNWVDWQLDYENIDDSALENMLAENFPSIHMTVGQLFTNYILTEQDFRAQWDLQTATTLRSLYSPRQLYERMCEFWADHFSIHQGTVGTLMTPSLREVIREHALGKFPDMLKASATDGAMLLYLTNASNVVGQAQENYAREVMELHTLGVGGPYTETDVEEMAKVLTGWSIYSSQFFSGDYTFFPTLHDYTTKQVLGHSIAPTGQSEGFKMLRILARHKSTRDHLAYKISRWLLQYEPPMALVHQVSRRYRETGGDIREMVRVILDYGNVLNYHDPSALKLKRPYQFLTSVCRASYVQMGIDDQFGLMPGDALLFSLQQLGQQLFANPSPDGYRDDEQAWGRSALPRWQFAQQLFDQGVYKVTPDIGRMFNLIGGLDYNQLGAQVNMLLTGGRLTSLEQNRIQTFVNLSPQTLQTVREALALGASTPSFQYY